MVSIKDIALRAGVSVTTVSHAVNGTRHVSDERRARVEEAIRVLGYVPSAVARSLKRNTTHTLGMLIPNSSNPYFAEIVRSVEDSCFGAGYTLILCNTYDEPNRQAIYLQVLAERRIDGLVVVSTGSDSALAHQLTGLGMPIVLVDREIEGDHGDLVETAHCQGALLATQHLASLGHRRIACISGPAGLAPSDQRVAGWRQGLGEAGLSDTSGELLWQGAFTSESGYTAMCALLQSEPRPDAVFVCNDLMAMGALRAAHEHGVRVPEALSLIGFDDIELAAYTSPPLSTVAQPKQRIGALAVEMLLERIAGRSEARKVLLQPALRLRGSTALAAHRLATGDCG